MFRACLGFSVGQNALGIYFPQVGQEEGICSPLCLLSQCPSMSQNTLPWAVLSFSLPCPPPHPPADAHCPHHLPGSHQLSCHPSLQVAQDQPHAQDDVSPPSQPEWWLLLIYLAFLPSFSSISIPKIQHQSPSDGLHGQGDISSFSLGQCFTAMFLGPIFIKSSFWKWLNNNLLNWTLRCSV